ncbi:MAG: hypothetical protein Q9202_003023 [Teloschistes flavicans]
MDPAKIPIFDRNAVSGQKSLYAPVSNVIYSNQGEKDAQGSPRLGLPVTPQRPLPNSSKKRTGPNLSRSTPASSHHNSISAIFHEAGKVLQAPSTSPTISAEARKLPMPLSKLGEPRRRLVAPNPQADMCTESIGRASPVPVADNLTNAPPQSDGVLYPDLSHLEPSPSPSRKIAGLSRGTPEDESCSTVPKVDNWLNDVFQGRHSEVVEHLEPLPNPTRRKSISPSRIPIASPRSLRTDGISPISTRTSLLGPGSLPPHPITRLGFPTGPLKRGLPAPSPYEARSPGKGNQEFDIYEDEVSDDLAELSPGVERHRKDNRPRRDRCASYWDEDILKENAEVPGDKRKENGARQVLGEIPSLTKAKVFMEGVEDAKFDFRNQAMRFENSSLETSDTVSNRCGRLSFDLSRFTPSKD